MYSERNEVGDPYSPAGRLNLVSFCPALCFELGYCTHGT